MSVRMRADQASRKTVDVEQSSLYSESHDEDDDECVRLIRTPVTSSSLGSVEHIGVGSHRLRDVVIVKPKRATTGARSSQSLPFAVLDEVLSDLTNPSSSDKPGPQIVYRTRIYGSVSSPVVCRMPYPSLATISGCVAIDAVAAWYIRR